MSHRHIGTRGWFAQTDRERRCRHPLGESCKVTYLKTQKEVSEVKTQAEWPVATCRGQVRFLRRGMGTRRQCHDNKSCPRHPHAQSQELSSPGFPLLSLQLHTPKAGQLCCSTSLESSRETSRAWCASSIFQVDTSHLTTGSTLCSPGKRSLV